MAKFVIGGREFTDQAAFISGGRRCGTPALNEFQKARIRSHMASFRAAAGDLPPETPIVVPVQFHVIHNGGVGDVTDAQLDQQITVLNQAYSPHSISFTLVTTDRTDNATWSQMTMGSLAERQAKQTLGRNTDKQLNLYTARIGAGLLGWATFPSDLAGDPDIDGVVVLDTSLPGGTSAPYDLGMTAVHEVGHWLGLYHTFEGGCQAPGDEVDDTPSEASPNFGPANPARDTCPGPGKDPTTNYMDYTDDAGMSELTPGQVMRIRQQVAIYRPALLGAVAPAAMTAASAVRVKLDLVTGSF